MGKIALWIIGLVILFGVVFVLFQNSAQTQTENVGLSQNGAENGNSVLDTPSDNSQTGSVKEFNVIAKQWEFDPGVIEVNKGDKVILHIKSVDVAHGIAIPEFGVSQDLSPGVEETVEFTADKKGTYSFFCNVYCGSGHRSMKGTLVVN